ncbi:hypothetical protein GK047_15555 [Paenibacillus sp. SYP-B3998]|uniref:DNA mismatch repair protein n=1 Tax=Paenibacillus sp. SYP-B3998 TaxID=2678564 RepID=A0A6G3ZZ95_9BACL|nr:hypothetical protein [Paenibacillus sp. SYP-B3998]NEW07420.1 hypothetical protein [Paenibacillus sp. SYP-B3998]
MVVSKQQVIEHGLAFLQGVGTEAICKVCIPNGGSCCNSCDFLLDRVGCQLRNTSCTSWLCGFQQYVLLEMDLLDTWKSFWKQVPGQDFRQDFTPDTVSINEWMEIPSISEVSHAFASDLQELLHLKLIHIRPFNDKLFTCMEKLSQCEDKGPRRYALKRINVHMKDFKQFKVLKDCLKPYKA